MIDELSRGLHDGFFVWSVETEAQAEIVWSGLLGMAVKVFSLQVQALHELK